jgi:hypothetical protein
MFELMFATLAWLPFTLGPVVLVLLAPLAGQRGRTAFATSLAVLVIAAIALAFVQAGEVAKLDVINPFFDPDKGEPVTFIVETVTAPGWHWPAVGAVILACAAAPMFVLRRRPPTAPCPVVYGSLVTLWTLAARLALEKAAAPEPLTWAIGVSVPMLVLLPFVGWWSGVRRFSFGKFVIVLLLLGLIQRSLIVVGAYFATTQGLGTHLDVSAITELTLPLGHKDFRGPGDNTVAQWIALMLVPQFMLWVPLTVLLGLMLGSLPLIRGKRRQN